MMEGIDTAVGPPYAPERRKLSGESLSPDRITVLPA